jgi:hypothetical protein
MFSKYKEDLNCNIGHRTDADRIQEIYYKYKSELMEKLNLSENEISDKWSDFCSDIWDDTWKTEKKSVGEFLDMFVEFLKLQNED